MQMLNNSLSITINQWRSHGVAQVGMCPPYLGQGGSWDLHKFKEFFGGVGVGVADSAWAWRYTEYLLWTYHENAFVHCRLYMHIWLLGAKPPDHRGSAPVPRWGTSIPQTSVSTLSPNPGYTTVINHFNVIQNICLSTLKCQSMGHYD